MSGLVGWGGWPQDPSPNRSICWKQNSRQRMKQKGLGWRWWVYPVLERRKIVTGSTALPGHQLSSVFGNKTIWFMEQEPNSGIDLTGYFSPKYILMQLSSHYESHFLFAISLKCVKIKIVLTQTIQLLMLYCV